MARMLPSTSSLDRYKEAVKMGLAALRGPTREQVEKEWRTHWVSVDSGRVSRCAHCGFEALYPEIYTFCPDCGRPFTDYAVDILLKRFEVLKDGKILDPVNCFFAEVDPYEYADILIMSVMTGQSMD